MPPLAWTASRCCARGMGSSPRRAAATAAGGGGGKGAAGSLRRVAVPPVRFPPLPPPLTALPYLAFGLPPPPAPPLSTLCGEEPRGAAAPLSAPLTRHQCVDGVSADNRLSAADFVAEGVRGGGRTVRGTGRAPPRARGRGRPCSAAADARAPIQDARGRRGWLGRAAGSRPPARRRPLPAVPSSPTARSPIVACRPRSLPRPVEGGWWGWVSRRGTIAGGTCSDCLLCLSPPPSPSPITRPPALRVPLFFSCLSRSSQGVWHGRHPPHAWGGGGRSRAVAALQGGGRHGALAAGLGRRPSIAAGRPMVQLAARPSAAARRALPGSPSPGG